MKHYLNNNYRGKSGRNPYPNSKYHEMKLSISVLSKGVASIGLHAVSFLCTECKASLTSKGLKNDVTLLLTLWMAIGHNFHSF